MARPPKSKGTQVAAPLPREIVEIAQLIQSGQLADWTIQKRSNGVTKFRGFDQVGHGIIIEKRDIDNYSRTTTETVTKPSSIIARRSLVKELRLEGMTQTAIAERTGYSQKTISNDCAELDL